jgi:hypothetical protein
MANDNKRAPLQTLEYKDEGHYTKAYFESSKDNFKFM